MSRYTSAYSSFVQRMGEVETLRAFAASKERSNPIVLRKDTNALCRGAIVLLSGHLEAYIKELGEVALDSLIQPGVSRAQLSSRFYYYISQDLIREVQDTNDPERLAEKVFAFIGSDLVYWSKTAPFAQGVPSDRFNKGFANPAFGKIKAYFNRFGYSGYEQDLARRLKATYLPTVNMLDHLVDVRNKVAHGDPAATKTPAEVKDIMSIVRSFCAATDGVFATWWKRGFCSIR